MSDDVIKSKKVAERKKWRDGNTTILLHLWEDSLEELNGPEKKSRTYRRMAEQLTCNGIATTGHEVKCKIDNMTRRYRIERQKVDPSGRRRSTWEHYNRVRRILKCYKPFNFSETRVESTNLHQLSSENSAEDFFSMVESGAEDEREFRERMLQLAEERNTAMLKIVGATVRMEEAMSSFLLGHESQNNNAQ